MAVEGESKWLVCAQPFMTACDEKIAEIRREIYRDVAERLRAVDSHEP
jgi:hypothetical protein